MVRAGDVAGGEDRRAARTQVLVDDDTVAELDARALQIGARKRRPARARIRGEQQGVVAQPVATGEDDLGCAGVDGFDRRAGAQLDLVLVVVRGVVDVGLLTRRRAPSSGTILCP
jgi:hypothetical protein